LARCSLAAPIVLLKTGESGSSAIVHGLEAALAPCVVYQEILHHVGTVSGTKCSPNLISKHEETFKQALAQNAVISTNPQTMAGGCFSMAVEGGGRRLAALLRNTNATIVAWTRTNTLRRTLGVAGTNARLAREGKQTVSRTPSVAARTVVKEVIQLSCEMLQVTKALQLSTAERYWHQHISYEQFAHDPLATMGKLLSWAQFKPGFDAEHVLDAYQGDLRTTHTEPQKELCSLEHHFDQPDEVLGNLSAACLDWMYWGGSYTNTSRPRPMCLSAPSCTSAKLTCDCNEKAILDSLLTAHETSAAAVANATWWP